MPFILESSDRQHFHKQGTLWLQEALASKTLERARGLSDTMAHRKPLIRDGHLEFDWMRKAAVEVGSIAASLWHERPLLLLGEQLMWAGFQSEASCKGASLSQIWSADPLLGGIALILSPPENSQELPSQVVCMRASAPLLLLPESHEIHHFASSSEPATHSYLLIWLFAFGTDQARYVKAPLDPSPEHYRERRRVPEGGRLAHARPLLVAR